MSSEEAAAIQSIAVIGAGPKGRSFAHRCLAAGYAVILEDVLSSNLRKAEQILRAQPDMVQGELHLASSVEDAVREADIAIDFVPDELESKLEILSMMDRMAPPRTIFCTPTTLSLSDLASCTYRAERCIALEPFEDLEHAQVTLVRGQATTEVTTGVVATWLRSLGMAVTVIVEPPGDSVA